VFERFTEPARGVVVLAQDEARELGQNYLGTMHLLLGLLREDRGLAAEVLAFLGVDAATVRGRAAQTGGASVTSGMIPFSPNAKKVLEQALLESIRRGHDLVGTEHLLLGLVSVADCAAAHVLGEKAGSIRDEIQRLIGPN